MVFTITKQPAYRLVSTAEELQFPLRCTLFGCLVFLRGGQDAPRRRQKSDYSGRTVGQPRHGVNCLRLADPW
jgi:hypothetical protein